jgi:ubiquinone/menaquinone biosynthesis C-methylase UbiE
MTIAEATTKPDLAAVKNRQQSAWASGDYAVIGTTLQIVGETLAEAADIRPDEAVLDVAAGNGNATLAAARRGAAVTSTDYVGALLERARERAHAERLSIAFQTADAEALPFADATFDVVLSTFGVMFTPDQPRAARELARVCRPGGRIALANWTPESFIGHLFKTMGKHLPPPAGVSSPALWGTTNRLQELFGPQAAMIETTTRQFNFRYRSAAHFVDVFRTWYGPVHKAFAALGDKASQLEADMHALIAKFDRGGGRSLVIPSDYLEVVITRR